MGQSLIQNVVPEPGVYQRCVGKDGCLEIIKEHALKKINPDALSRIAGNIHQYSFRGQIEGTLIAVERVPDASKIMDQRRSKHCYDNETSHFIHKDPGVMEKGSLSIRQDHKIRGRVKALLARRLCFNVISKSSRGRNRKVPTGSWCRVLVKW